MALDSLIQGLAPANVNSTSTSIGQIPDWLANYQSGVAGKAVGIAGQGYTPYPGQRLADFSPDQQAAFSQIRASQGNWKPDINSAESLASGVTGDVNSRLGAASGYGQDATQLAGSAGATANNAVAGPAQTWTNNWQQYMSPYTSSVVNEIGRLGNQNLQENILPGVQSDFLGAGQFGSTRNADILGRSIRDAQADISGKQASALEGGYGTAANIFGADAGRQQQQQQLQAQTALGAGTLGSNAAISAGGLANNGAQIGANAALGASQQLGQLGSLQQNLGLRDAQALGTAGALQQSLSQQGLDTGYQDFLNQRDWDKNQLTWLNSMNKNNIVPNSSSTTSNAPLPGAGYGPSTLSLINSGVGLWNNLSSNPSSSLLSNNAGVLSNNPGLSSSDIYSF